MASVLEYALRLSTSRFDNPLRDAEGNLARFRAALPGVAAGLLGATTAMAAFGVATKIASGILESYADFDSLIRGLRTLDGTAEATGKRLAELQEIARAPGLGVEEAIKGDIRLRAAGVSAKLSADALKAFGNALATIGAGKGELDGVILALTQITAKGKVMAQEVNQIAERLPQTRVALQNAFGTADTEVLQARGLNAQEFIRGITDELAKLPKVTSGARNSLDNYSDAWKALKNTATEFSVSIAGTWIDSVSDALQQATKDLRKFQELLGIQPPALQGEGGVDDKFKQAQARRAEKVAAEATAAETERQLAKENADFYYQLEIQRAAGAEAMAAERIALEKKTAATLRGLQERAFAARLSPEADLERRLNALRTAGPSGAVAINETVDLTAKTAIAERTVQIVELEKELKNLQDQRAEKAATEAKAAAARAAAAEKEAAARRRAAEDFSKESAILEARGRRQTKLAEILERETKAEKLKREIMDSQGLAEPDAAKAAEKRLALEDRAAKPRRGIGSFEETAEIRKRIREAEAARRAALKPDKAADALARGNAAADPGRDRRAEREAARAAANPLVSPVQKILEKFDKLATA